MRRLAILALLLSGCAWWRGVVARDEARHGHCAYLCDRFSTVPIMTAAYAVDAKTCRCVAFPDKFEKKVYVGASWRADLHCEPDCRTLADRARRHERFPVAVHR